jgi:hypothetical protein
VRLTNLQQAKIGHAVTDVLALLMTSMGPKVQNRDLIPANIPIWA